MNLRRLIALIGIVLLASCAERTNPDVFTEILDSVKSVYAPDKRVALVDFSLEGNVVKGETNITEAKELLVKLLNERGFQYTDSMKMLPEDRKSTSLNSSHVKISY